MSENNKLTAKAALKLSLTCSAAVVAEAVTYPIDVVKTRLQLQGELGSGHRCAGAGGKPYGAVRMALELVRREGVRGLYAGLTPALIRHVFYTGTRISVYEWLRSASTAPASIAAAASSSTASQPSSSAQTPSFFSSFSSSSSSSSSSSFSSSSSATGAGASGGGEGSGASGGGGLGSKLVIGLTAGAVGQAVAVPADLVKVRLQAEGRQVAAGKQLVPRYKGVGDCLRQVVAADGWVGLWRGGGPAVQRAALVNLGELATYDQAKQAILAGGLTGGDNLAAHTAASVCSGFFASVVSVPADVVKTRMMSQDPRTPRYRSSLDCLVKSVRAEGVMALYKGFLPTWARLGPWQLVFWTAYEQMRTAAGLGGF